MFEELRRDIAWRREARRKARLKEIEKARRLSYIQTQRLKEREAAEQELRTQVGAELSAREKAKTALAERRQAERELRASRGPTTSARLLRGVSRVAKGIFYTAPVATVRGASKLSQPGKLDKLIMGPTDMVFGKPSQSQQSLHDFMFGGLGGTAKSRQTTPRKKPLGIFEVDKDIFG